MSGLVKPKEYKLSESNIANLGSDLEKQVKKAAAETEDAWKGAGKNPGMQIWRIEKFKVIPWPKDQYGTFYSGDSYICLHTYEKDKNQAKNRVMQNGKWVEVDGALAWDVHFWLGQFTSQDEAGTAAYKTVELDDYLDGAPIQYREAMGHESDRFVGYFNNNVKILEGGVDSGFKKVGPKVYETRLMHVKGKKKCRVMQVELSGDSLNGGDVFLLDMGLLIIQWNGSKSSVAERNKAAQISQALKNERMGKAQVRVNDQDAEDPEFWAAFKGGKPSKIKTAEEVEKDEEAEAGGEKIRKLFRLSDATGSMKFSLEAEGAKIKRSMLDTNDVFVYDSGSDVWVWVGKNTTPAEKKQGLGYAQKYLTEYKRPQWLPISKVLEGAENEVFNACFV